MSNEKHWPAGAKVAVAVVLGLAGLIVPILFIPAVLILLSIGGDGKLTMRESAPASSRMGLTSSHPGWRSAWIRECESPAEEAFLNAAIDQFELVPDRGNLRKDNFTLQPQVLIDRYRVDFVFNERLVVEVDGAAYHSSPEQVERDQLRDRDLHNLGWRVLRLPASLVFRDPHEAIRRVRAALEMLPPLPPSPAPFISKQHLKDTTKALSNAVASIGPVLDELNRQSSRYLEAQRNRKEPPPAKWLDDSEFERQLQERVAARVATADPSETQFDFTGVMRSMLKERYTREERDGLIKEWDLRAASLPTDAEFHRRLSARVDARVAAHKFRPDVEARFRATGTLEILSESVRAKVRWEEEGRLLDEWSRNQPRVADDAR